MFLLKYKFIETRNDPIVSTAITQHRETRSFIFFAFTYLCTITFTKQLQLHTLFEYATTMKFRNDDVAAFLAAFFLFGSITMVTAERKIKYLFNSKTYSCTSQDLDKVDAIFSRPQRNRRQLRSKSAQQTKRDLFLRKCARDCEFIARGYCQVTDCMGYRRELQQPKANKFFTCGDETNDIDQQLQMLIDNQEVTESCQKFLDPIYREVSCYDNVIYGVVENVQLWNMSASLTKPVLITDDLTDGFPICKSLMFNIEAKVNNCVDFVHFHMEGPNFSRDHTEDDVPYSLFGDSDTNIMFGKKLFYSGVYTLTIIPDGIESKMRTIQLNVLKC
jgi:hypothetical protein